MNCKGCAYKYTCGYSSLLGGKDSRECIEPHLYRQQQDGYFWGYKSQKLVPEKQARAERPVLFEF